MQVLGLCRKAGLAGLDRHGAKIKANVSTYKAMTCARMVETAAELTREVAEWLSRAAAADARANAAHNSTRSGDCSRLCGRWVRKQASRRQKVWQAGSGHALQTLNWRT